MFKTITNKLFSFLCFLLFGGTAVSQNICRDTSCADFKNAIEESQLSPEYSGYLINRFKTVKTTNSKVLVDYYYLRKNAYDIIYPEGKIYMREKEDFKDGQIVEVTLVKNGVKVLTYKFHDNGSISSLRYAYGKARGRSFITKFGKYPLISYYKNGNINTLNYFNDRSERFLSISYYPDQTIKFKASFANGNYKGVITSYHPNGKISKIGMASNDLMNGYLLTYNEIGELINTEYYKKNNLIDNNDSLNNKSQFFILKLLADEENKNVDRNKQLILSKEDLKKTEAEKKQKEEEVSRQEAELTKQKLELELFSKNKVISDLILKTKESEIIKARSLAEEKRNEIERLSQQKTITELTLKNQSVELTKREVEAEVNASKLSALSKENKIKELEASRKESELNQQRIIRNLFIVGFLLVLGLTFFVFRNYREKQKANIEITIQKHLIEEKNHEITDSINYAQRIQRSILPPLLEISSALPNSFVLFKPKDIVSGDFYWFFNSREGGVGKAEDKNDPGKILIAAADCTGHGVPGAFMSTIGSEKLNEAVKESTDVSEILNLVNRGMKKVLRQSEKADSTRDGMDIALIAFNKEMTQVEYAGANRPLWIVRKNPSPVYPEPVEGEMGKSEVLETKATKVAIGGYTEDEQVFTKHTIDLQKGDSVYIFSDGYADQFSPQDKKLMTRKFKEILLSIQDKSMEEQKEFLGTFIEDWRGDMEQTDDILVIGVRV